MGTRVRVCGRNCQYNTRCLLATLEEAKAQFQKSWDESCITFR